jgi:5-hydroxyisourate hydrolase-like protein (transthyretin family)
LKRHLVARGRVRVGDGFSACASGVAVKIQRKHQGTWKVVGSDLTNADGRYAEAIADKDGRYRAVVAKSSPNGGADVCRRAVSAVKRHH